MSHYNYEATFHIPVVTFQMLGKCHIILTLMLVCVPQINVKAATLWGAAMQAACL